MPTYRPLFCSDPLPPEGQVRWLEAETWLGLQGWRAGAEGWSLTPDPTGGTQAGRRLREVLEAEERNGSSGDPEARAWWSMSDNTLVLNGLIDRGLCRIFHGHPLTLAGRDAEAQRRRFQLWSDALIRGEPFPAAAVPPVRVLRGAWPDQAPVVGGNLTALETLAAAGRLPRAEGRILLVESLSCPAEAALPRLTRLLAQPGLGGVLGVAVGRFSRADRDAPGWLDRWEPAGAAARWPLVGHGSDGWTVPLGEPIVFTRSSGE